MSIDISIVIIRQLMSLVIIHQYPPYSSNKPFDIVTFSKNCTSIDMISISTPIDVLIINTLVDVSKIITSCD